MPSPYTYRSSNPRTVLNPILSIPLLRPVHQVLGWTAAQKVEFGLAVACNNLATLLNSGYLENAYRTLGEANRIKSAMRRHWQSKAFRSINAARASIRAARKAVAQAEAAMLDLPTELRQPA